MRNLKRVLSLALALVMMLSLMIVGASAVESTQDFSDAADIQNSEAVNVLVNLNVINGQDDGRFNPNGNITRSEMAKMICVVLNGGKDPLLGSDANTMFTDTVNHWAKAYIAYCTNIDVVAGRGDGRFDPDANVTGTEVAKMLLVALGYDAEVFKLVGSEWATSTEVIANGIDLFDGLRGVNLSAPLSRDNAARMIYNALNAYVMEKSYDKVLNDGTVSYNYALSEYKTLLNDTYGAWRVEGVVVANEYASLDAVADDCERDGDTVIKITNADELETARGVQALNVTDGVESTFKVSTGKDMLGKAVVLYVKPAQNSKSTDKATVIGSVILGDNTVLTKDNKYNNVNALNNALKGAGLKTTLPNEYYVNGNKVGANYNTLPAVNVNGYRTEFIDNNGDGEVDFVLVDKVDFGKITVYTTGNNASLTVAAGLGEADAGKYDKDDVVGFDDVAKNDYVLWSYAGGRLYVEQVESVTGDLTNYSKQTADEAAVASVWIDGTKYNNSGATFYADGSKLNAPATYATGANVLDKEAIFYFDACGYVVAIDGTSVAQYALATYYNANAYNENAITTSARAQVYFEDGLSNAPLVDTGCAAITALGTLGASGHNYAKDVVLGSYTYNTDNELVLNNSGVKAVDNDSDGDSTGDAAFKYTSGNILVTYNGANLKTDAEAGTGSNVYMTDKTVVFFVETKNNGSINNTQVNKVTVYNGKDKVPSIELQANTDYIVQYLVNDKNEITAMAIISSSISSVASNYLYVISVDSSSATTRDVKVVIDGAVKNITVNIKSDAAKIDTGKVYEYSIESNGNYKLSDSISPAKLVSKALIERVNTNERTVVVNGVEYKVTDSTDIADLDDKSIIALENLQVGDVVTVYHDNQTTKTALGIYVHEAYSPENANIVKVATVAASSASAGDLTEAATGSKVNASAAGHYNVTAKTSLTATQLKDALTVSYKAAVGVYDEFACTTASTTLTDGNTYYVKVTAEDGTVKVYEFQVTILSGSAGLSFVQGEAEGNNNKSVDIADTSKGTSKITSITVDGTSIKVGLNPDGNTVANDDTITFDLTPAAGATAADVTDVVSTNGTTGFVEVTLKRANGAWPTATVTMTAADGTEVAYTVSVISGDAGLDKDTVEALPELKINSGSPTDATVSAELTGTTLAVTVTKGQTTDATVAATWTVTLDGITPRDTTNSIIYAGAYDADITSGSSVTVNITTDGTNWTIDHDTFTVVAQDGTHETYTITCETGA